MQRSVLDDRLITTNRMNGQEEELRLNSLTLLIILLREEYHKESLLNLGDITTFEFEH